MVQYFGSLLQVCKVTGKSRTYFANYQLFTGDDETRLGRKEGFKDMWDGFRREFGLRLSMFPSNLASEADSNKGAKCQQPFNPFERQRYGSGDRCRKGLLTAKASRSDRHESRSSFCSSIGSILGGPWLLLQSYHFGGDRGTLPIGFQ